MKILIVGAGIAGLSVAKALEMRGYKPQIAERKSGANTEGQSLFLLGNATRALKELRLDDQMRSIGHTIHMQTIMSSGGTLLNEVLVDTTWSATGPCLSVTRQGLINALEASLEYSTIAYNTSVLRTVSKSEAREVHFLDGRIEDFDLVIGPDGIRSQLRIATFPTSLPRSLDLAAWRIIVDNNYGIDRWTAMLGNKRTLLAIPLKESRLYIYADSPLTDFGDGSVQTLKALFGQFAAPLGPIISELENETIAYRSELEEVPADRYLAKNLVLIGDAAHGSSPSMAQGAGMAIEDGIVLADCIANHVSLQDALNKYRDRREQRVKWVQEQSRARDKLRVAPSLVRNQILRFFGTRLYQRAYAPLLGDL